MLVKAVAVHDVGQFVKYHSEGKRYFGSLTLGFWRNAVEKFL